MQKTADQTNTSPSLAEVKEKLKAKGVINSNSQIKTIFHNKFFWLAMLLVAFILGASTRPTSVPTKTATDSAKIVVTTVPTVIPTVEPTIEPTVKPTAIPVTTEGKYSVAKQSYMDSCIAKNADLKPYCDCTYEYLIKKIGLSGIMQEGINYTDTKKLSPIMVEAATKCVELIGGE